MGRKRRSSMLDFMNSFNQAYSTIGKVMQDNEMRDIGEAKPEELTQYTPDQASQLEAAASAKDAEGRPLYNVQANEGGTYSVAPTAGGEAGTVAPGQRTKFLGQTYDKPLSEGEQDKARLMAMSGVMAKHGDPIKAMQLRQQATQADLMQQQGVLGALNIEEAQRKNEVAKKLKEADTEVSTWMKDRIKLGEDGQPQPLTDDDFILGGKRRVLSLANRGLFNEAQQAGEQAMNYATKKIQAETTERAAAVRDATAKAMQGDLVTALSVYNKYLPDGSTATGAKTNKDGSISVDRISAVDGSKLPAGKFKDMDAFVSALNSIADPGAASQYLARTFQHDIESRRLGVEQGKLGVEQGRLGVAKDAETRAGNKDTREQNKLDAVSKGLADYAEAEQAGDKNAMAAARRAVLANGGKLDKPEVAKSDVKVGTMGDITVSQPTGGGGVKVINYGPDMKSKGSVNVPGPGQAGAANGPKVGDVVQGFEFLGGDPNDKKNWKKK